MTGVKEEPADCTSIDEVSAAPKKKMKRHKAADVSRLVAEMIQATGDIGTQRILERRLHYGGLEVKCGTTYIQRERRMVWIL